MFTLNWIKPQTTSPWSSYTVKSVYCNRRAIGIPNLWPLLTGGRCSELTFVTKSENVGLHNGGCGLVRGYCDAQV